SRLAHGAVLAAPRRARAGPAGSRSSIPRTSGPPTVARLAAGPAGSADRSRSGFPIPVRHHPLSVSASGVPAVADSALFAAPHECAATRSAGTAPWPRSSTHPPPHYRDWSSPVSRPRPCSRSRAPATADWLALSLRSHAAPALLHRDRLPARLHPALSRLAPVARASDALQLQAACAPALLLVRPFAH